MISIFPGSIPSSCRVMTLIHILTTEGRTDKHNVYRTITFNRLCNVLKVNPIGRKQYTVPNISQNRRPYLTQTLLQFSASPSPFLGTTENAKFVHFMHLKTDFLLDYQVLFLILNGPQIEKRLQFNRSILIDLWHQKVAIRWFCPLPLKRGNL